MINQLMTVKHNAKKTVQFQTASCRVLTKEDGLKLFTEAAARLTKKRKDYNSIGVHRYTFSEASAFIVNRDNTGSLRNNRPSLEDGFGIPVFDYTEWTASGISDTEVSDLVRVAESFGIVTNYKAKGVKYGYSSLSVQFEKQFSSVEFLKFAETYISTSTRLVHPRVLNSYSEVLKYTVFDGGCEPMLLASAFSYTPRELDLLNSSPPSPPTPSSAACPG
jgi:hypothetical protein